MSYTKPESVTSPKKHWTLLEVLRDTGSGGDSLAVGKWYGATVLAMRWNGDQANSLGNPQSRGLPTWFVVPEPYYDQIIALLPSEKKELAKTYLKRRQQEEAKVLHGDDRGNLSTVSGKAG